MLYYSILNLKELKKHYFYKGIIMKKQAGPFGRMRSYRTGYLSQPSTATNFNPVQGQINSMNGGLQTNNNPLPTQTQRPAAINQNTTTQQAQTQPAVQSQQVNFPSATNPQNNRPKMQPVQMSQYYRDSMQAIRHLNDFSKYTPKTIAKGLQDAVKKGSISQQESQMLQNEFNTRYDQWQKRPRGSVTTRPAAQPVVRNQQNTIDTKIDNLNSDIDAFANEDAWDTQPLAPNSLDPMYAGPGAAIFNDEIPVEIPVPDENGGGTVHNTYLEPDQFAIYQQNMADEVVARERDEWNRNRIRTGSKPPKPMEWQADRDNRAREARVKHEYDTRKATLAQTIQQIADRQNINEAAEYANNQAMPMSGTGYEHQPRNTRPTKEEQIIKKQRELSGQLARLGGRNYGYLGGNATQEQLSERENEARNWLARNPTHPNAPKVRKSLRELDQIRGGQSYSS